MSGRTLGLKILVQGQDQTSGLFGKLKSSLSLLGFGLQNLGTQGIRGFAAVRDGIGGVLGVFLKLAAVGALVGGVIAVAIGVLAVKAAGTFQQSMLSLVAHAGLAKSQFDNVSQSVLGMATSLGRSPTELADALYPILSAFSGITNQSAKSALALTTLKMSFQAVAGTTVNGTAVANAAVGTFNALGLSTNNAALNAKRMANLFDVMDLTVQQGNMQWDAYKNVISKLAVSIAGTSVKFNEASAALATLTNEGMSAQKSQTYLSNLFTTMAIKTDLLAAHAKKLKIAFDEQKYSSMNLADKIGYLNQVTDGNKQKILALLGNNATALKAFNALSVGIKGYASNLKGLDHAHGALAASFATASSGFTFMMSKIGAAGQVLLVTIGQNLLPVMTQLAGKILPIISGMGDWIIKNHVVENAIAGVKNVLSVLVPILLIVGKGVLSLALGMGRMVGWFLGASAPAQVLRAVLVGIGVAITTIKIAQFIMTIPALVVGFFAWAGAAGAAAVATIAATWPILAIGAVIALVVAGIVLAVTHWGAVGTWLHNVWNTVTSGIGRFFAMIGGWIHNLTSAFSNMAGPVKVAIAILLFPLAPIIGPILAIIFVITHLRQIFSTMGTLWSVVVRAFKAGVKAVVDSITAPFRFIGSLFVWLYNHNTYVKMLVDTIVSLFQGGIAWLRTAWFTVVSWLGNLWLGLVAQAKFLWNAVTTSILVPVRLVIATIQSVWTTAIAALGALWATISGLAQRAWNAVTGVFRAAWTGISSALSGLWNNFSSWFGNLAKQALTWGANVISGFVGGILSKIGAVKDAVGSVIHNVAGLIGFHSPTKEGPGRTADQWAPSLMKMYAAGILQGIPTIRALVTETANVVEEGLYSPNAWKKKGPTKTVVHKKKPTGGTLGGVSAPASGGGVYTTGGGGTIGGGSGNTYNIVINSSVNVTMPKGSIDQQAQTLANKVDADLGKIYRSIGLDTTTSSGSAA